MNGAFLHPQHPQIEMLPILWTLEWNASFLCPLKRSQYMLRIKNEAKKHVAIIFLFNNFINSWCYASEYSNFSAFFQHSPPPLCPAYVPCRWGKSDRVLLKLWDKLTNALRKLI